MRISRRDFLTGVASVAALTAQVWAPRLLARPRGTLLLGCRTDQQGRHHLTALTRDSIRFNVELPARGHDVLVDPAGTHCVVFARRPGDYMWVVDLDSGQVVHKCSSSAGRHFYGHGVFSAGLLFVTENAYVSGAGIIGVYDSRDGFKRLGEFSSHGIDPHDINTLDAGRILAIANGGIRTHPDLGRSKLNLRDMQPSLTYVETASGQLLGSYRPPDAWHQLSIRHLDVFDDQVCIAMQFEGAANLHPPLVALHRGEDQLHFLNAPEPIQLQMRNYCGSICCDRAGTSFCVSSPRGNRVTFWSLDTGDYLNAVTINDGCGVAAQAVDGYLISSGEGDLLQRDGSGSTSRWPNFPLSPAQYRWDNHLIAHLF